MQGRECDIAMMRCAAFCVRSAARTCQRRQRTTAAVVQLLPSWHSIRRVNAGEWRRRHPERIRSSDVRVDWTVKRGCCLS